MKASSSYLSASGTDGQYTALTVICYTSNRMLKLTELSDNLIPNSWEKWIGPTWISHRTLIESPLCDRDGWGEWGTELTKTSQMTTCYFEQFPKRGKSAELDRCPRVVA